MRVGVTKYGKLLGFELSGSVDGTGEHPRPLTNTVRTPTDKSVWGIYIYREREGGEREERERERREEKRREERGRERDDERGREREREKERRER